MKNEPQSPKSPPCGNDVFGCRQRVERSEWLRDLRCCKACVRKASRFWCVAPSDLMLVLAAHQAARAGLDGRRPSQAQVWAVLRQAGVERIIPIPDPPKHPPAESCLPGGDRVMA